ncbi:hypothetical protein ACJIZ3_011127 [Penstemon smallii]|uniref:Uncharacterized protein n=1 Tax=Penstemon smallii TaxID=265156 RepID=A0ABD3UIN2_9LAMI
MPQEDHIQSCSYGGGGDSGRGGGGGGGGGDSGRGGGGGVSSSCSSRSKKIKKKKLPPQRGLGVAQLERIRIEEQQREDALQTANVLANNNNNNNNLPSPNSFFRPSPEIEISNQSPVRIPSQLNVISSHGHGNWPRLLNSEYYLEIEKQRLDHHGFAFGVNLPYGSVPQRSHQIQQHFSSMVNAPSTVPRSQTEPPSNQSFRSNYYHTLMIPEEDKMFGMKRPYPFFLETPQAPSFNCFPGSRSRSDEVSGSCSNGNTAHVEPRKKTYIRDGSSSSSGISNVDGTLNRDLLNRDFLTLAPPSLDSKQKHQEREPLYDSKCMPSQENARTEINQLGSMEQPEHQQLFSFFPVEMQNDQTSTNPSNGSDEESETIDLNLKL